MTMGAYLVCVSLGARASAQAAAFGLCFAAGLAAGVFALLYLVRLKFAERVLLDIFASAAIAAGAALCTEFILGGVPEPYGMIAYLLGTGALPCLAAKIRRSRAAKNAKESQMSSKNKNIS